MRRTTLLLVAIALLPRTPLCGQVVDSLEPPVIRRIVVHTRNVFDSTEAGQNFFFRLANAIHFTTQPSVVRHELLFREGEPYDQAKVDESLRNLRSRGLFRDVAVYTVPAGDSIDVIVETADAVMVAPKSSPKSAAVVASPSTDAASVP